jgi:hypothetical protein
LDISFGTNSSTRVLGQGWVKTIVLLSYSSR